MKSKKKSGPLKGTIYTNLQIPGVLHEAMKQIRQARYEREGSDVKLCRIYREAVEQYLNAQPQQQLLKEFADATAKTGRGPRSGTLAARV